MKRYIILALFCLTLSAQALEWNTCCAYITRNDPDAKWTLFDDGAGVYIKDWSSIVPKPTEAEVQAVESQAVAWMLNATKERQSNLDDISPKTMKALLSAMIKVINLRLPADKKITAQEMKDAIKAEL